VEIDLAMETVEMVLDVFGCAAQLDHFEVVQLVSAPTRDDDITRNTPDPHRPWSVLHLDRADAVLTGLFLHPKPVCLFSPPVTNLSVSMSDRRACPNPIGMSLFTIGLSAVTLGGDASPLRASVARGSRRLDS
jgi:hypothetical protein